VLSRCASHVVTVERHATLADRARATLAELGYRNVEVHAGDGSIGQPDRAPFDAIVVTAAAVSAPPPALLRQLVPGGVLVCPVKGESDDEQLVRVRDGEIEVIAAVRFVPLVEDGS
jgi:protein-L-isoaspartate(D-aspartate) O-methyltransferase